MKHLLYLAFHVLLWQNSSSRQRYAAHAFAVPQDAAKSSTTTTPTRGGGRAPSEADKIDDGQQQQQHHWEVTPNEDGECRLIICQITDGTSVVSCVLVK